ncbi:MAG TPA: undecaprenyl-diphosphate phosphatase [Bacteroidota bacterium]|nr:undecaprenyl-diphosphate phosphatase [Bacteroidota bacterium]
MTILQSILLGLVQGFTEFLPVSSSGHLVLAEVLFDIAPSNDVTFEVFVHFGTLLSVLVAFRDEIQRIIVAVALGLSPFNIGKVYYRENEYFRLGIAIFVGSIPAGIIGILYEKEITQTFTDPKLVAVMLVITGLILFLTKLARPSVGKRIGTRSALLIGLAQAFAIIPGISRSGSTISMALFLKHPPAIAARFSFLLSLPVIAGATLLKTFELFQNGGPADGWVQLLFGTLAAFASGYLAIRLLLKIIQRGKLSSFSFYCLTVGALAIVYL